MLAQTIAEIEREAAAFDATMADQASAYARRGMLARHGLTEADLGRRRSRRSSRPTPSRPRRNRSGKPAALGPIEGPT